MQMTEIPSSEGDKSAKKRDYAEAHGNEVKTIYHVWKIRPGPKPILEELELQLVQAINAAKSIGQELTRAEILRLAKDIDLENGGHFFPNIAPSDMWYTRFCKRHNLDTYKPRILPIDKAKTTAEKIRNDFFTQYEKLMQRFNFTPQTIFNMDESSLLVVNGDFPATTGHVQDDLLKKLKHRCEKTSVVVAANAAGNVVIPPMIVFKRGYLTTKISPKDYPSDTSFAVSESGYMTSELFLRWMEIFIHHLPPARPVLLMLDTHISHIAVEISKLAKDNKIELLYFPPNTTDLYQPFDVRVFKSLERSFETHVANKARQKRRTINKYDFGKVFTPAFYESVTPLNVIEGFKRTGIWPIDKDVTINWNSKPPTTCTVSNSPLLTSLASNSPQPSVISSDSSPSSVLSASSPTSIGAGSTPPPITSDPTPPPNVSPNMTPPRLSPPHATIPSPTASTSSQPPTIINKRSVIISPNRTSHKTMPPPSYAATTSQRMTNLREAVSQRLQFDPRKIPSNFHHIEENTNIKENFIPNHEHNDRTCRLCYEQYARNRFEGWVRCPCGHWSHVGCARAGLCVHCAKHT